MLSFYSISNQWYLSIFISLYERPMDTDLVCGDNLSLHPPRGAGAPFLGQNRANWRANKKWLSWPFYKSKKIFCLGLNWTYEYRKNLILKLLGSGPFSIRQTKKKPISTEVTKIGLGFFPPNHFLIFQWKSINRVLGYSPLRGKFAIWAFRGQTSHLF